MSLLSTESLLIIAMAADCAVRGESVTSLKTRISEKEYIQLLIDVKQNPDEFRKAQVQAEKRFVKEGFKKAFKNVLCLANSDNEKTALKASLGLLKHQIDRKKQQLEVRKLKLRERIIDREEKRAIAKEEREKKKQEPPPKQAVQQCAPKYREEDFSPEERKKHEEFMKRCRELAGEVQYVDVLPRNVNDDNQISKNQCFDASDQYYRDRVEPGDSNSTCMAARPMVGRPPT